MNLSVFKSARKTNLILALMGTIAIAGWKKDFSIGNMVVCFLVAYLLLVVIDLLDGWMKKKLNRKIAKRNGGM